LNYQGAAGNSKGDGSLDMNSELQEQNSWMQRTCIIINGIKN